ncbi:MAG: nuclear transport factor 2 family protein [Bauldia sp.]|nr:nuclear transport factor 2 family protein [Bauldia sp.]
MRSFSRIITAAALIGAVASPAAAQITNEEAEAAVMTWLDAIIAGPAALELVLAPEFQIQRADGNGLDRAGYLGGGAATITEIHGIHDLVVTAHGDLMVVRYLLVVAETIGGVTVEREAPRLSVFRREGDRWLIVAHANFARLEQ